MKATVIDEDGGEEEVELSEDNMLEELQRHVGGYIERVPTMNRERDIIVDEEGLLKNKNINVKASNIAKRVVVGTAVILDGKLP